MRPGAVHAALAVLALAARGTAVAHPRGLCHSSALVRASALPARARRLPVAPRAVLRLAAADDDEIEVEEVIAEITGDGEDAAGYREAITQTLIIVALAVAFGAGIWVMRGEEDAAQYFAGYVIEESLSVDNLFVFKLIFDYFGVVGDAQSKCLRWGIAAAAIFRLVMISLGVEAVHAFRPVLLVFAGILLLSSFSIIAESFSEPEEPDLTNNPVVNLCKRLLPTTDEMCGDRFWVEAPPPADGVEGAGVQWLATPLLVALACIEVSDVIFAVDSVPAVLGVTDVPLIAFSSNVFAILGLRALYRILSRLVADFDYLQPAVALVLGFVGSKMIGEYYGVEVSITTSLGIIVGILAGGIGLSVWDPPINLFNAQAAKDAGDADARGGRADEAPGSAASAHARRPLGDTPADPVDARTGEGAAPLSGRPAAGGGESGSARRGNDSGGGGS